MIAPGPYVPKFPFPVSQIITGSVPSRQDDIGVVKYAVPIPATPPTVPANVRKVLLDMASGLISGIFGA